MSALDTQLVLEGILRSATRNGLATQFLMEVLVSSLMPAIRIRNTQYVIECIYPNPASNSAREKEIFYKLIMLG